MGMTTEEIEELEDLYNDTLKELVACEGDEEEIHYRGKLLGMVTMLDILGYEPKEHGAEKVYFPKDGKPVKYYRYKIVKKEE